MRWSLISDRVVITAAHCFSNGMDLDNSGVMVDLADHDSNENKNEQRLSVKRVIKHSEYDEEALVNDIALLILEEDYDSRGGAIGPINLPVTNIAELYDEGAAVTVIGWGGTESGDMAETLQKLSYNVAGREDCNKFWGGTLPPKTMCTNIKDKPLTSHSWAGDSGGPLFVTKDGKFYLLGLVSFGVENPDVEAYDVNTDVSKFVDWITQNMNDSDDDDKEPDDGDKKPDDDDKEPDDGDKEPDDGDEKPDDDDKEPDDGDEKPDDGDNKPDDDDKEPDDGDEKPGESIISLVGGQSENEGFLFIEHMVSGREVEGMVCNDRFGHNEVTAVCRHLGYEYGKVMSFWEFYDHEKFASSSFGFTNVECPSSAENVFDHCSMESYSDDSSENMITPCFDGDQVAVSCSNSIFDMRVEEVKYKVRSLKQQDILRVKARCEAVLQKYGQDIPDLGNIASAQIVNVKADGTVDQINEKLKYQRRKNMFVGKSEVPMIDEKEICLACVFRLNMASHKVVFGIDEEHCAHDFEQAEEWLAEWAGMNDDKEDGDDKPDDGDNKPDDGDNKPDDKEDGDDKPDE